MNEDNIFEVGKIVKLKSGGPEMTIKSAKRKFNKLDEEWLGAYHCQWFAGKKLELGEFPHDSLDVVAPVIPEQELQA